MVKRLPAMLETRVRFLGREDPLEKEMAIHSSTLAWKIPWTEEFDTIFEGFPGGLEVKASASNVGNPGSFPVSGRSPGEGNGNPLQYSCLENLMKESLVGYSPWGCKESDSTERQMRKGKICPFECRVPKNSKER